MSTDDNDDLGTDDLEPGGAGGFSATTGALAAAAPIALLIGAAGGLLLGAAAAWVFKPDNIVEIPRAPTEEEIAAACVEEVEEVEDELTEAQTKVMTLERDVAEKERAVKEMEAEMARRADAGKAMAAELKRVKAELADAKEALKVAEEEKKVLLEELRMTEQELEVTKVQRDNAREDAVFNRWEDFVKGAQLEICDKGNRKKLGNCRETVEAQIMVPERQSRFAHCIRSGQAEPIVKELEKGMTMPTYSEMINDDEKVTKDWMIIFCDPTLPERPDAALAERHLPKTR